MRVKFLNDESRLIMRNVKGPVREVRRGAREVPSRQSRGGMRAMTAHRCFPPSQGDILTLMESEREARRLR